MLNVDVVIFGGGIAGLWTLARLSNLGYNAILLETEALGSGQTIKSQGVIHGGLKYALSGHLSTNVTALQSMPQLWQQCLDGVGEINLQHANILARSQYMWSVDRLTGGLAALFASSALKSHVEVANKGNWPLAIQQSAIQSKLYELSELVLDIPSVLRTISAPLLSRCIKLKNSESYLFEIDNDHAITSVAVNTTSGTANIKAKYYIFTAGSGNSQITRVLPHAPAMQLRPLQMVLVKSKNLMSLYGHCISLNTVPRMTITTHAACDNIPVWYLGGKIAEDGVNRTPKEQIIFAKQELQQIFPQLDLTTAQFATFFVDRAEAKQADGAKPATITVYQNNNYITAWPTKLALAPLLAQEIVNKLQNNGVEPSHNALPPAIDSLPKPDISTAIWDQIL